MTPEVTPPMNAMAIASLAKSWWILPRHYLAVPTPARTWYTSLRFEKKVMLLTPQSSLEFRWSGLPLWHVLHPSAMIFCLQLSLSSQPHIWSDLDDESHMIVSPLGNDTEVVFLRQGARKL